LRQGISRTQRRRSQGRQGNDEGNDQRLATGVTRCLRHGQTSESASGPRGYRGSPPEPQHNFYLMFRQLTLVGYFTSEPGFTKELHEEIIPGRFDGCVPLAPETRTKGS